LDILTIVGSVDKMHSSNKQELTKVAGQIDSKVTKKKRSKDEAPTKKPKKAKPSA
jgi:hypothetical protein